ncbi:hypothetical protein CEXT_9551 [Caerostris extrusa]|uniref:Uncharacterized protein n=1 Tax=Caerostris extrusa TaxID=172846 RepID=A0AAV4YC83_CAEEX|nr:hypothetical protein CEXT_9551 [Caerostris extrusa]
MQTPESQPCRVVSHFPTAQYPSVPSLCADPSKHLHRSPTVPSRLSRHKNRLRDVEHNTGVVSATLRVQGDHGHLGSSPNPVTWTRSQMSCKDTVAPG